MNTIAAWKLTNLRKDGQWSQLYLAGLEAPRVVMAARVAQAFPSHASWDNKARDEIMQVTFETVTSGSYSAVIAGMTVWVGSSAGACDVGQARVRKVSESEPTILYIGEESDIDWDRGLYLTVIDEFGLWAKHAKIISEIPYMDGDIAYSDQHLYINPVPVMGSDAVLDVTAYPATLALDGSNSWLFDSAVESYLWTASAGTLSNSASATPTLTVASYPSGGVIRLSLTVTAVITGKTKTGYRYVYVYDTTHRPETVFQVGSLACDMESGGWEFDVTMAGDAAYVRDRAKVILFSRDYYGSSRVEMGQQIGRENIVCIGWIDGETIQYNPNENSVSFSVKGPQFWLNRMPGFPPGVEMNPTPAWTSFPTLTVDKALWHLLEWRSTATAVMDITLTGNSLYASAFEVPAESLWQQIIEIAQTSILAVPCCDLFGRFFIGIDPQYTPVADRNIPEVMRIEKSDWSDALQIESAIVDTTAMLDLSGVAVRPYSTALPFFSLAPGHVFRRYGEVETLDRLLLESQAQANELAGLVMGRKNNPIPSMDITLAANNRLIDIAPFNYLLLTIEAADNNRGMEFDGRVIPRSISVEWDSESGFLKHTLTVEPESFPTLAITGDPPSVAPNPPTPPTPSTPPPPPIGGGIPIDGVKEVIIATTDYGILYTVNFDDDEPQWFYMNAGMTENETKNVVKFWITADGAIFALVTTDVGKGTTSGKDRVYVAYGLGSTWYSLIDGPSSNIEKPMEHPIIGFGVDDVGNCIAILLDDQLDNHLFGTAHVFAGNSGGVGKTDSWDEVQRHFSELTSNGTWLFVNSHRVGLSAEAAVTTLDGGGEVALANQKILIDGDGVILSGLTLQYRAGGIVACSLSGGGYLYITGDNGTNWEKVDTAASDVVGVQTPCALCQSPSGIISGNGNVAEVGKQTSDLGYTWAALGTVTTGFRRWANGGDDVKWLAAKDAEVWFTENNGLIWHDKTGNLQDVAPACNIDLINVVGFAAE